MLKEVEQFLLETIKENEENNKKNISYNKEEKKLTFAVAYSGGIDSNVLLNIAYKLKDKLNYNLIAIHVNYNLRGEESIGDEMFARDTAKNYNIDIYVKQIEKGSYNNKNTQLEARKDRYLFFKELYNKKIYDYLLIAHNKDDLTETIIYRMIKGSGTNIYKALSKKRKYVLRPILNFYRKDIENYAKENNLSHREDSSNKTNKYSRNKLRNVIIPMLEEINLQAKNNIIKFAYRVYEESNILRKKVNKTYKKIEISRNKINIKNIKNKLVLKKIIIKFLFKNNIEITEKRLLEILKIIYSKKPNIALRLDDYNFVKSYDMLEIVKTNNINTDSITVYNDGVYNFAGKTINIKTVLNKDIDYKKNIYIKKTFPIVIRKRKEGDFLYSYPNGDKKYLRKILIDLKIPFKERDLIPIIESENEIAAIYLEPYGINRVSKNYALNNSDEYAIEIEIF
ncbi:tRNA lysidine(34) synthetase TilS [Brachyspira pilosicoli]|uniref:tRNA(Ile)-lysidine synthase n=1 Tax=Brachyspira pilosicoli TaxID=52584 RepID=A0A5C8EWD9_BRAPL|nr:tRNA lysidine(34) synthetase TilS [Brachyspira pilosicoli]TXJ42106.1 tRNA lysidine(34) synthetase TilS [Brachyspira pilosicoli]